MKVKDHLAGRLAIGLMEVEPLSTCLLDESRGDTLGGGEDGVPRRVVQIEEARGVGPGNHQGMPQSSGLDIQESQDQVILVQLMGGEIPGDDHAEWATHAAHLLSLLSPSSEDL